MDFQFRSAFAHKDLMAELYGEYNELLLETDPNFEACLAMQNYDKELEQLELKFAPPENDLIIALDGNTAAGCVGIKKFSEDICELKRLYVRPAFRKSGLGTYLTKMMMDKARSIGYRYMYLDTMPGLESAVRMYARMGFYEIEKYYPNPVEKMIYLCYDL